MTRFFFFFTCHCSNTEWNGHQIWVAFKANLGGKKILQPPQLGFNSHPFNHENSTLPTELSWLRLSVFHTAQVQPGGSLSLLADYTSSQNFWGSQLLVIIGFLLFLTKKSMLHQLVLPSFFFCRVPGKCKVSIWKKIVYLVQDIKMLGNLPISM